MTIEGEFIMQVFNSRDHQQLKTPGCGRFMNMWLRIVCQRGVKKHQSNKVSVGIFEEGGQEAKNP